MSTSGASRTPTTRCTLTEVPLTRIAVNQRQGQHRAAMTSGLLRPQQVHSRPGWCRVGLVATTALLLGGDTVELEVEVGPSARLDLFDVAGTVALDGRGLAAAWHVRIRLGCGARLRLSGQPLVVATGARVTRSLQLDVADGARALLRDTVVLGRYGEQGGWLQSTTAIRVAEELVLLEDQELDPSWRELPGHLGDHRLLDTITAVGLPLPAPGPGDDPAVAHFRLPGDRGVVRRHLGRELAVSPIHDEWERLSSTPEGRAF